MVNSIIIAVAAAIGMILGLVGGVYMSVPKIKLPEKKQEVIVDLADPVAPKTMDDFTQVAKELDDWRKELTAKRDQSIRYDAELLKREQLLRAERDALNRERQRLTDLQKDIQTSLIKIKASEEPKLAQMADLYQTMKAEDSVALLKEMNTSDATKIFTHLSEKTQAKYVSIWLNTAQTPEDKKALMNILDAMKKVVPDDGSTPPDASAPPADGSAPPTDASAPPPASN